MAASEFAAWFSSDPSRPYQDIQVHGLPATGEIEAFMDGAKAYSAEAFPGMTMAPYHLPRKVTRISNAQEADWGLQTMKIVERQGTRLALLDLALSA